MNAPAASEMPTNAFAGSRNPGRECGELGSVDGSRIRPLPPIDRAQALEYALSPEGLYEALHKCATGTRWKRSVGSFELNGWERCINLSEKLRNGTYTPNKPTHFTITHPKRREICSIGITDRVYQRSLNDNVVYPAIAPSLIKENCACQVGKGPDYARDLLIRDMKNFWHSYGTDGYVLQMDVRGYYPNMHHEVAEQMFAHYLDGESLQRVLDILRTQYAGEIGYQPGSQLLQIAGISVLSPIDHMIKERLRFKRYIRYMDDMLVIGRDKRELERVRDEVSTSLGSLDLSLNESKTRIISLTQRIPFLGFTFQLKETGFVYVRAMPSKVRSSKRAIKNRVTACKAGHLTHEVVDEMAKDRVRYYRKRCSDAKTPESFWAYYQSLWR